MSSTIVGKKRKQPVAAPPPLPLAAHPAGLPDHLQPGCRVSVWWDGDSFTGTVLRMVHKCTRVKVLLARTAEWKEHEHEAELKDVKPLVVLEEGGHAVMGTAEGKSRKQPVASPEAEEALSEQVGGENEALKQCKQEYVEEEHAALQLGLQQTISAVHAVAQCVICFGTMKEASTVSGCGHTFCRGCIVEAVRANNCCPVCKQPVWNYEVRPARRLSGVIGALEGFGKDK
mgnify:CR=1 FL=1